MGQLEDLTIYVQILDSGSISKAATRLNVAKSAISRRLSILEDRYEATLIERSKVTETGEELRRRAMSVIEEVNDLDAEFVSSSTGLEGPLSVSVPRDFGLGYLNNALTAFKVRYPDISLTVDFDDRVVDLSQENYDFAIRITDSIEPMNSAIRIGSIEHALYASTVYFENRSEPENLDDLLTHQLLSYGRARLAGWEFMLEKQKAFRFEFKPFLNSNSGLFLLDATLKGLGISRLPDFIAQNSLETHEGVHRGNQKVMRFNRRILTGI